MNKVTTLLGKIGDVALYEVGAGDEAVAVALEGQHQGYDLVVEGLPQAPGSAWTHREIYVKGEGGYTAEGNRAFKVHRPDEARYFAVDVRHPVPLARLRLKLQQWYGAPGSALHVTLTGLDRSPLAGAERGAARSLDVVSGAILTLPARAVDGPGTSEPANAGAAPQLLVGVNVTKTVGFGEDEEGHVRAAVFRVETLMPDGVWYPVWESERFYGPDQALGNIGAYLETPRLFTNVVRLAWDFEQTHNGPPPADWPAPRLTFSAGIVARAAV